MDISVRRNAFGPQRASFEQWLSIPALGEAPFQAVFIRAPLIISAGLEVEVLARVDGGIVMARQGNMLVSAFHPELVGDTRVHEYFLSMVDLWRDGLAKASLMRLRALDPAASMTLTH